MARMLISVQASNEAGPAESAVSPGSKRIPEPKTDPIYKGIICRSESEAVLGIDGSTDITDFLFMAETLSFIIRVKKR